MTPRTASSRRRSAAMSAGSQFLTEAGQLVLRVSGPGQPERQVRLQAVKCTVGSAQGCTLRLVAPGVKAIECWILRGCGGTVIRRLGKSTLLNGTHFDEAMLASGDRLTIGPVAIVVEDCGQAAADELELNPMPAEGAGDLSELETRLDQALDQIRRLQGETRQGFESSIISADRADQLRDALAAANEQLEDVCAELTTAQQTIERQAGELTAARNAVEQYTGELKTAKHQIAAIQQQAAATGQTNGRLTSELVAANEQLVALRQQVASAEPPSERLVGELVAVKETLERQSRQLNEERVKVVELEAAAGISANALRRLESELASTRTERDALREQLAAKTVEIAAVLERHTANEATSAHLSDQLEKANQTISDLQSQLASAGDRAGAKAELADREAQLAEALQNLEQQQGALAAEAEQLSIVKQKLAEKERQLSTAALQLEQAQQALSTHEERSDKIDQRLSEFEGRAADVAGRMAELDQLLEQVIDERANLSGREQDICQREREFDERWNALNQQAEQFQVRREQLDAVQIELQEREAQLTREAASQREAAPAQTAWNANPRFDDVAATICSQPGMDRLDRTLAASDLISPSTDDHFQQPLPEPEVNSVLDRLASTGVWRQNDACQDADVGEPMVTEPAMTQPAMIEPARLQPQFNPLQFDEQKAYCAPVRPSMPHATAGTEEESIESYMQRLMQRVRGDSSDLEPTVTQTTPKPPTSVFGSAPPADNINATMVVPIVPQTALEDEPMPVDAASKRQSADLSANLSAMREVAYSAAQAAINHHVRKKTRKRANRKLLGACLALGGSLLLAYFAWEAESTPGMAGAAVGCTIAAYWMLGAAQEFLGLDQAKPADHE